VISDRLIGIAVGLRGVGRESEAEKRTFPWAQSDKRVVGVKHGLFRVAGGARPELVCVKVQQKAKGMRFVPGRARSRELESRWGQSELTLLLLGNPSEARQFDLPSSVTSYD
jgi:hypothetical protein